MLAVVLTRCAWVLALCAAIARALDVDELYDAHQARAARRAARRRGRLARRQQGGPSPVVYGMCPAAAAPTVTSTLTSRTSICVTASTVTAETTRCGTVRQDAQGSPSTSTVLQSRRLLACDGALIVVIPPPDTTTLATRTEATPTVYEVSTTTTTFSVTATTTSTVSVDTCRVGGTITIIYTRSDMQGLRPTAEATPLTSSVCPQ